MTTLKSMAERERDRRVAWGRAKQALQEFLYHSHHVGSDRQRKDEAAVVLEFIRRMQELIK